MVPIMTFLRTCLLAAPLLPSLLLLPAAPARATSVGEVMAAYATMHQLDGLGEADYLAMRRAHEAEYLAATQVLNLAHMAYETMLATAEEARLRYGVKLICNYNEDFDEADDDDLVDIFIADGRARHGLPEDEARRRLYQADYVEMLTHAMMRRFPCPGYISDSP